MKTKLVPANLTVETFIQRTMAGEVFYNQADGLSYFYCTDNLIGPFIETYSSSNTLCRMNAGWDDISKMETAKPITWQDEVSEKNPVLCWVTQSHITGSAVARSIVGRHSDTNIYKDTHGDYWSKATPVKPTECYGE